MKKVVLFFAVAMAMVSCNNAQQENAQEAIDSTIVATVDTVVATVVDSAAVDSVVANIEQTVDSAAAVVEEIAK